MTDLSSSWLLVFSRAVEFGSVTTLFGAALFSIYAPMAVRNRAALWPALAMIAAAASVSWAAASFIGAAGSASDLIDPVVLRAYFLATAFGVAWLIRFGLHAAAVIIAFRYVNDAGTKTFAWSMTILSGALILSQAWIGHAASFVALRDWPPVVIYVVHVLAAGVWVGGLVGLTPSLWHARATVRQTVLQRFSAVGFAAVVLIVVTGLANTGLHISSLSMLVESSYGRLITGKAALLTCALVLAVRNTRSMSATNPLSLRELRRNVAAEQLILGGTLVAAALLGVQAPE